MIQGNFSNTEIDGDDFEGEDMRIDSSQQELMFDILFKQMYRKPIASIIREITSNCFDSHIEAKVDEPVLIKISNDEGGTYISFKDVGIGISPERMKKVYSRPLKSSKRDSNEQIGFFGLGSKSPFAYTDSFFLTTIFDNIKYEYLIHRGKTKPRIDKLSEDETEEHNGSEVKIYFLNNSDRAHFEQELGKELVYFDNVYFSPSIPLNNNYTIFEYNTFKLRTDTRYSDELHICIGKVAYPINWGELGIRAIKLPFGLKFNIGDLPITPERESIRYVNNLNEEGEIISSTKDIIVAKVEAFKKELQDLYDEKKEEYIDDLEEYLKKRRDIYSLTIGDKVFNLNKLIEPKEIIYTPLKNFKGTIPDQPLFSYEIKAQAYKGNKLKTYEHRVQLNINRLKDTLVLKFPVSGKLNTKKTAYFYDFASENYINKNQFLFIEYRTAKNHREIKDILELLGFSTKDKRVFDLSETNLTQQVKLYKDTIRREVSRLSFDYESFIIPPEWITAYNEANKIKRARGDDEVLVYDLGVDNSDNKRYINPTDLEKFTGFILYGFDSDEDYLKFWRTAIMNSKYKAPSNQGYVIDPRKCKLFKIAQRNEKYLTNLKHSIHIEDFMGDNKIFKRFATAAMIAGKSKALKLKGHHGGSLKNTMNFSDALDVIFTPAAIALKNLYKDVEDFGGSAFDLSASNTTTTNELYQKLKDEIIGVSEDYNLYDTEMLKSYQKLERYVEGLELINFIVINEESLELIADFIKLKGKPVNKVWENKECFEYELIKESVSKVKYQLSIYGELHERYKYDAYSTRVTPYPGAYSSTTATTTTLNPTQVLRDNLTKKINNFSQNLVKYNCIIKYYERKTEGNQV